MFSASHEFPQKILKEERWLKREDHVRKLVFLEVSKEFIANTMQLAGSTLVKHFMHFAYTKLPVQ